MLSSFSVTNYKSIKETLTLSLVANKSDAEHPEAVCFPEEGKQDVSQPLLKSAAVYGPNNSGKTNLFDAAKIMRQLVLTSSRLDESDDEKNGSFLSKVQPFKLSKETVDEPTVFEVVFFIGIAQYEYGFAATSKKIIEEWLYVWPTGSGRKRVWFERSTPVDGESSWHFGPSFKGEREVIRKSCRDDTLFISVAAALNNAQIRKVRDWFHHQFRFLECGSDALLYTKGKLNKDENFRKWAFDALKTADFGVSEVELLHEKNADKININFSNKVPDELKSKLLAKIKSDLETRIQVAHQGEDGTVCQFDLEEDESDGTEKFLSLLGPFKDVFEKGGVLWVDELESSLHPLLVRALIKLFQTSDQNKLGAQLVFTTHQSVLLDSDIFRRDQIYLMGKDPNGESHLASLLEFKARKDEAWCKGYLTGRYGAIPDIHLDHVGVK